MSDSRRGQQRPTLLHEPPDAVDWTLSDIAVDFASSVGYVLDEWQQWLVRWTFVRRADRLWAARDVGAEVPRQNGKNIWLEVVELASLVLFGDRLIIHSAHRADVSHEHFLSLKEHIESADDLMDAMPTGRANKGFITTNGNESIEFDSGARLLFKARAKASGRGPRPQKIVFDEALVLEQEQIGSMAPGISAQRNPQVIFASSPPKATSTVQHGLRARALKPEPGDRLFYAAWNNPTQTDVNDREAMYRVNPSLGCGRMTEDSLTANRKLMSPEEYLREHMGVPEAPLDAEDAVDMDAWRELAVDPDSDDAVIVAGLSWGLDVSPDRKWASFGIAGRTADRRVLLDVRDRRPGTGWVVEAAKVMDAELGVPLRIDPSAPAGSLIGELTEAGVEVVEVAPRSLAQACGAFLDGVTNETLAHLSQPWLDTALLSAAKRDLSDAEAWSRKHSTGDISGLVAVTLALGGVSAAQPFFVY